MAQSGASVAGPSRSRSRPRRLVMVLGTGTDVGKTWVAARLLADLRAQGITVAARKPAQSFAPGDDPALRDAAVLGGASGEPPEVVCPPHRWYEVPMAPPMAADALGRSSFGIADLVSEIRWPAGAGSPSASGRLRPAGPVDVGLVETAGGVRSPIADDGDCAALCDAVAPDLVLLVADAGLGTINSVRLSVAALSGRATRRDVAVVLNRFDPGHDLHRRNRGWLADREQLRVVCTPVGWAELLALVRDR